MTSTHVWTETLAGSTVRAVIRCDDPVLRPRRGRRVPAYVVRADGQRETACFEVTFTDAAVWDVARIDSRLRLRQAESPRPSGFALVAR